jgi:MYXO-CTERM domain-containing protein
MQRSFVPVLAAVATVFSVQAAQADTVATFADPAVNGTTPVFTFTGAALFGGWNGLALQQGASFGGATFNSASFSMAPVGVVGTGPGYYDLGPGAIVFLDSSSLPLLNITFTSARVVTGLQFGGSDFTSNNVVFSGPLLNGNLVSNEAFSFAFANPMTTQGTGYTATSSFTSSADIVPAPGACALLGLGGLLAGRRRR